MRKNTTIGVFLLACGLSVLAACSHEGADWKAAATANTPDAYQQFVSQYPKSPNVPEAQARIAQLQEAQDWQSATSTDTRAGYEQYLAQHGNSPNAQEARIRLENFAQAGGAPAVVAGSAAAAAAAPASKPAAAPTGSTTHGGATHYVQLGAFSSRAHAERHWKRLAGKFSRELGSLTPRYVAGKSHAASVVRLQVAVDSREQARSLCERLRAHAQACVPVGTG